MPGVQGSGAGRRSVEGDGCFCELEVHFLGVLVLGALLFWLYIGAPGFWKLPDEFWPKLCILFLLKATSCTTAVPEIVHDYFGSSAKSSLVVKDVERPILRCLLAA